MQQIGAAKEHVLAADRLAGNVRVELALQCLPPLALRLPSGDGVKQQRPHGRQRDRHNGAENKHGQSKRPPEPGQGHRRIDPDGQNHRLGIVEILIAHLQVEGVVTRRQTTVGDHPLTTEVPALFASLQVAEELKTFRRRAQVTATETDGQRLAAEHHNVLPLVPLATDSGDVPHRKPGIGLVAAEPALRPQPYHCLIVLKDAPHLVTGQAVIGGIAPPGAPIVTGNPTERAKPKGAAAILGDGNNTVSGQAIGHSVGCPLPIPIAADAASPGAEPQRAIIALQDSTHLVGGEPRIGPSERLQPLLPIVAAHTLPRRHPQNPLLIFQESQDAIAHQSRGVGRRHRLPPLAIVAAEALVRADPQRAVTGLFDGEDGVCGQAILGAAEQLPLLAIEAGQPPTIGADPQRTLGGPVKGRNAVRRQTRHVAVAWGKGRMPGVPIEVAQAALCAPHPQISVCPLGQGTDRLSDRSLPGTGVVAAHSSHGAKPQGPVGILNDAGDTVRRQAIGRGQPGELTAIIVVGAAAIGAQPEEATVILGQRPHFGHRQACPVLSIEVPDAIQCGHP